MVGPDFKSPPAPHISRYSSSPTPSETVLVSGIKQKFTVKDSIEHQWWTLFGSKNLNQIIDLGLQNNPTLQAAQAAIRQAQENLKIAFGGFFPSIDAQASGSRQRESEESSGINTPSIVYNLYTVGLNVSYSLDIFGALRRQVEALGAQVDYQRFELEAAYLTLTTNLVTSAIREASLRAQIQATRDILQAQKNQLDIITSQFRLGGVSQLDILEQEMLVAQTQSTLPPLENALSQVRHSLAILVGEAPSQVVLPIFTFSDIDLPIDLPITLPAILVQNRPDIKAAEALLHEACAQIGVTKANMFPQLSITGSLADISDQFRSIFASSSSVWSMGSNLLQPVFRGGAMVAKEDAAIAAYDQAFAQYRLAVLQSFQQVADVLQAIVEDAKTYQALKISEKTLLETLQISQKQYQMGSVSFFAVLTAERQYHQARINCIQAKETRYMDTAALFQALGGDSFLYRKRRIQISQNFSELGCVKELTS